MADPNDSAGTFQGEVFQLGFDEGSGFCTASLRNAGGDITVSTLEGRMQTLLETALVKSMQAFITYEGGDSNTLRSVSINIDS